jgi:N-acylneuraminate cytidylyltransferase
VFFCVTQPFIKVDSVKIMVKKVLFDNYDSAFMAEEIKGFCWYNNKPINYFEGDVPRTQELQPILKETGGLYIFKKDLFKTYRRRIGFRPYIRKVGPIEGLDIDTEEDFKIAEQILRGDHGNTDG